MKLMTLALVMMGCSSMTNKLPKDSYLYLEKTDDEKTQSFIKSENKKVDVKLTSHKDFKSVKAGILKMLSDKDKIPAPTVYGDYVYTVWNDEKNPQGIIRRMKFDQYKKYGVKKNFHPKWQVVLDLDKAGKKDHKTWVLKNFDVFPQNPDRLLLKLSDGGKDASYLKEYDLKKKRFLSKKEKGFELTENKFYFDIISNDEIYVSTALEGDFVSSSGYPLSIKSWKRGTPIKDAKEVFRGEKTDLWAWNNCPINPKETGYDCLYGRGIDFYKGAIALEKDGKVYPVQIDELIKYKMTFQGKLYFQAKKDLGSFKVGDLLTLEISNVFKNQFDLKLFFRPSKGQSIDYVFTTKNHAYIVMSENVSNKLYHIKGTKLEGIDFPEHASISVTGVDEHDTRDEFFLYDQSFLRPYGIYHVDEKSKATLLRKKKDLFNNSGMVTEQLWATSKDGTKVPYYVIRKKSLKMNNENPVWIYAYGGFESSMTPWYSGAIGKFWLKKGGVYVLANIRGGGEFGPNWHRQALKQNRFRTYDDYFAVAEDLIARNFTRKGKIGISGGSNGGLLTGVGLTQRPDLYGAVISAAPLLDMFRYHKLPPGDSWVAEYGNVEKDHKVFDFWTKYSPYQSLDQNKTYPPTLIMTSTTDDRVHPGHARKMAAKMLEYKKPVIFYENTQGGHAGSANLKQRAKQSAYTYSFLYKNLMDL